MKKRKLVLIDGHAIIHRALTPSEGTVPRLPAPEAAGNSGQVYNKLNLLNFFGSVNLDPVKFS